MNDISIALSRVHFPITTLGPGQRLGIWFQGCSIRCPGCISADTWGPGRSQVTLTDLLSRITPWLELCDGITISGGEPFDQSEALQALLRAIRRRTTADILLYTGYPLADIQAQLNGFVGLVDAIVSDPFLLTEPQTKALRGSDNQQLSLLTDLGRDRFSSYERPLNEGDYALDIMFDNDGSVWISGIPRRDDLNKLSDQLSLRGHQIKTSVHHAGRRKLKRP